MRGYRARLRVAVLSIVSACSIAGCGSSGGFTTMWQNDDVWRGHTVSSVPVATYELQATNPNAAGVFSAGVFQSRLMSKPGPHDVTLTRGGSGAVNRQNLWVEWSRDTWLGNLTLGGSRRSAGDSLGNGAMLPGGTEVYADLSSTKAAALAHGVQYNVRWTQDASGGRRSLLEGGLNLQVLIAPLPYATSLRLGGTVGVNPVAPPRSAATEGEVRFAQRGIAHTSESVGVVTQVAWQANTAFFLDVTWRQNIDPATKVTSRDDRDRRATLVRLGASVSIPDTWKHE